MTLMEQIITIAICIVCVQFTRLLPFWIFPANRPIPEYVRYLGKVLPAAMFGMLVVYCYKNVDVLSSCHRLARFYCGSFGIGIAFLEKEYVSFHLGRHNFLYVFSAKSLYLSEC